MVILLLIALYYNFLFTPLLSKNQELTMQSEMIKNQRMQIELAIIEQDSIEKEIAGMKAVLADSKQMKLIDGTDLADDINAKAALEGINLMDVTISDAELAGESSDPQKSLLVVNAIVRFTGDAGRAAAFLSTFEKSSTGAYYVSGITTTQNEKGVLIFDVTLQLYYFGNASAVKPAAADGSSEATSAGGQTWAQ